MTQIEGPYSFKGVDGLKTPVYIFLPGGEKKFIGEAAVKVDGGMTFDIQLDEEYKDIETGSFDVPMRYTYLNLPDKPRINWRQNCLTEGPHDGRPEAIWRLPLLHAIRVFPADVFSHLIIARIHNDAMQYVEYGREPRPTEEWADWVTTLSAEKFPRILQHKVGEISKYYDSPAFKRDLNNVTELIKTNKLNPGYQPLHGHDSINLLCRIIGTSAALEASE